MEEKRCQRNELLSESLVLLWVYYSVGPMCTKAYSELCMVFRDNMIEPASARILMLSIFYKSNTSTSSEKIWRLSWDINPRTLFKMMIMIIHEGKYNVLPTAAPCTLKLNHYIRANCDTASCDLKLCLFTWISPDHIHCLQSKSDSLTPFFTGALNPKV